MNEKRIIPQVWVTAHIETKGIQMYENVECVEEGMIVIRDVCTFNIYFHKPNWHETFNEAITHAIKKCERAIANCDKKKSKLEERLKGYRLFNV